MLTRRRCCCCPRPSDGRTLYLTDSVLPITSLALAPDIGFGGWVSAVTTIFKPGTFACPFGNASLYYTLSGPTVDVGTGCNCRYLLEAWVGETAGCPDAVAPTTFMFNLPVDAGASHCVPFLWQAVVLPGNIAPFAPFELYRAYGGGTVTYTVTS